MEVTKDIFKKIVLCLIAISLLTAIGHSLPFLSDYEALEGELNLGYLDQLLNIEIRILILSLLIITNLIGVILLYLFKPMGRPIYLWSSLLFILFIMFDGDWIQYSILYPMDLALSFLEVFIVYLIYLTPLKEEFVKRTE